MDTLKLLLLFTGLIHRAVSLTLFSYEMINSYLRSLTLKKSLELDVISEKPTVFGDSPHWCAKTQSLYYVDFFGVDFHICRYDYRESTIYTALIENAPPNAGFIIPIEGRPNEFAVGFSDRTVKRISWNGKSKKAFILGKLFEVEQDPYYKDNIWHVGKTDPLNRFVGGTMRKELCTRSTAPDGSVYSYDQSKVTKRIEYVELSNGIAHSLRRRKMYHINACEFVVKAYDWNIMTGQIS